MTVLDLTAPPVTWASCYVKIRDPLLPHQLNIVWDRLSPGKTTLLAPHCNCGHQLGIFRPEESQSLWVIQKRYEAHVRSLL